MRTDRPTTEEADEAQQNLEAAILKFSDEARAPRERGTPNPDPTWGPKPSTLRFSYIRNGGWAWSMEANDQQIRAYYFVPQGKDPYGCITATGQQRNNLWTNTLPVKLHIYPTESPWREWYDYRERYQMEQTEPIRRY